MEFTYLKISHEITISEQNYPEKYKGKLVIEWSSRNDKSTIEVLENAIQFYKSQTELE